MTEAFENGQISNFEGLVTWTLDRVTLHTVEHHSLTSTWPLPKCEISLKSNKRFVDGWTYALMCVHTDGHLRPAILGQLCQSVDLKIQWQTKQLFPAATILIATGPYKPELVGTMLWHYETRVTKPGCNHSVQTRTVTYNTSPSQQYSVVHVLEITTHVSK